MTQLELLSWLSSQDFCDAILDTPQTIGTPLSDGTQWYAITIREVHESTAITRRIHFYVVNENTPNETAYWKDTTPTATLQTTTKSSHVYKMITFRTLIHELGSTMVATILTKLKANVSQNIILEQAYKMLESYGPDGGIDINSQNTQIAIQSLIASNILTQSEVDAIITLADADLRTASVE